MSADEPTRRPDAREPLRGAHPDEVDFDQDAVEGHVMEDEEPIDESPQPGKLDEDLSDEEE